MPNGLQKFCVLAAAMIVGCDRASTTLNQGSATPPAPGPVVATDSAFTVPPIAANSSQTQPSVSAPALLYMADQGATQQLWFPPAILRLAQSGDHVVARLTTDDPPAAINDAYMGNSFDLDMPLNIADVSKLNEGLWEYHAVSAEKQDDSPHGIFLSGQRIRLHPESAVARFERHGNRAFVDVQGNFYLYESSSTDRSLNPPRKVTLMGRIDASISDK